MQRQSKHFFFVAVAFLLAAEAAWAWDAEILSAREILQSGSSGSRLDFVSRNGVRLRLDLDPTRLEFSNPNVTDRFHPITVEQVRAVLAETGGRVAPETSPRIYCLPGLPRGVHSSFSVANEIFLSPGLAEISPAVIAYTITHELGHFVQHVYMPGRRGRVWSRYVDLRSLDSQIHRESAMHRDRPGEIFAEDFRALFGGADATRSRSLENPVLAWPDQVDGLREYFLSLPELASDASPSPEERLVARGGDWGPADAPAGPHLSPGDASRLSSRATPARDSAVPAAEAAVHRRRRRFVPASP